MTFKRILDNSYPHVYDKWEKDGVAWVIQDLPPEDHDEALKVLTDHLCTDEVLCSISKLIDEPESIQSMCDFWRVYLAKNTSLGCYIVEEGGKRLVALNVCYVGSNGEPEDIEIVGEKWKNVYDVIHYCDTKFDSFEYLGEEKLLKGLGLVVSREYRGSRLGARILAAREPLCHVLGIKATTTVFTGIASQKCALRCGYTEVLNVPMRELAEIGLKYPKDDPRSVKVLVKKYS